MFIALNCEIEAELAAAAPCVGPIFPAFPIRKQLKHQPINFVTQLDVVQIKYSVITRSTGLTEASYWVIGT